MSNVISEKQQKNTLRGKKGKKETIKNVLASPYTHYWPLINNEDDSNLKQILKCNLPKIEQKKNMPWKEIQHIPKEERREYRKKKLNLNIKSIDSASKYMYFGINEVTKLLERDEAISVLLTHDVSPQLMIKHVVDLCVFKQIPILVVPNLKTFLKESVGISAAAIAFKENTSCDSKVNSIRKVIDDIFANYPVPEKHSKFHAKVEISFFTSAAIENKTDVEAEQPIENIYLYRNSTTCGRVFVPRTSNESKRARIDMMETDSTGFISFNNTDDDAASIYKSLVVKRIKSNPARNKKKFDIIKNMRRK